MITKKMDYTASSKADMKHEKLAAVLNHLEHSHDECLLHISFITASSQSNEKVL